MPASVTVEGGGSGSYLDCFSDASHTRIKDSSFLVNACFIAKNNNHVACCRGHKSTTRSEARSLTLAS